MVHLKIEQIFVNAISKSKLSNVKRILDEDVSFVEYHKNKMPKRNLIQLGLKILNVNTKEFNVNSIMNLLKRSRPDIYNMIRTHSNGLRWMHNTVAELRKMYLT